jgi:hypothetical protein
MSSPLKLPDPRRKIADRCILIAQLADGFPEIAAACSEEFFPVVASIADEELRNWCGLADAQREKLCNLVAAKAWGSLGSLNYITNQQVRFFRRGIYRQEKKQLVRSLSALETTDPAQPKPEYRSQGAFVRGPVARLVGKRLACRWSNGMTEFFNLLCLSNARWLCLRYFSTRTLGKGKANEISASLNLSNSTLSRVKVELADCGHQLELARTGSETNPDDCEQLVQELETLPDVMSILSHLRQLPPAQLNSPRHRSLVALVQGLRQLQRRFRDGFLADAVEQLTQLPNSATSQDPLTLDDPLVVVAGALKPSCPMGYLEAIHQQPCPQPKAQRVREGKRAPVNAIERLREVLPGDSLEREIVESLHHGSSPATIAKWLHTQKPRLLAPRFKAAVKRLKRWANYLSWTPAQDNPWALHAQRESVYFLEVPKSLRKRKESIIAAIAMLQQWNEAVCSAWPRGQQNEGIVEAMLAAITTDILDELCALVRC